MSLYFVILYGEKEGEEYVFKCGHIRGKEDLDFYGNKIIISWFSDTNSYDIYNAQKVTRIHIEEVIV